MKAIRQPRKASVLLVTPLAGVWIERNSSLVSSRCTSSLPLRECGLKAICYWPAQRRSKSLPLRECGLKVTTSSCWMPHSPVTPLAGVWIERVVFFGIICAWKVTPLAGVWIERTMITVLLNCRCVTPLAGVWIERKIKSVTSGYACVTPLAGVWIERLTDIYTELILISSLPLRECGLKDDICQSQRYHIMSLPLRECGLKDIG